MAEIIESHILGGKPVERLLYKDPSTKKCAAAAIVFNDHQVAIEIRLRPVGDQAVIPSDENRARCGRQYRRACLNDELDAGVRPERSPARAAIRVSLVRPRRAGRRNRSLEP